MDVLWQPFCSTREDPRVGEGRKGANTEWILKRKSTYQRTKKSQRTRSLRILRGWIKPEWKSALDLELCGY